MVCTATVVLTAILNMKRLGEFECDLSTDSHGVWHQQESRQIRWYTTEGGGVMVNRIGERPSRHEAGYAIDRETRKPLDLEIAWHHERTAALIADGLLAERV